MTNLYQDATSSPDALSNPFYAPQGTKYKLRFSWTPLSGYVGAQLAFRLKDWADWYALNLYPWQIGLSVYQGGVYSDKAFAPRAIDTSHPAALTLVMSGSKFSVKDNAAPGSPTILTWTDPDNMFPTGIAVSMITNMACYGRWDSVVGTPL